MSIRFHRTALAKGDKGDEAGVFAAEVTKYVTENWGWTMTWGWQVGGTNGTAHWFVDYANMAEMEAALGRTMIDEGYRNLLAEAQDYFVTGTVEDTIIYTM